MSYSLVLTLIGPDRPGLVESLAKIVAAHDGNWGECRMVHLAGKFAGVLSIDIDEERRSALSQALEVLVKEGYKFVIEDSNGDDDGGGYQIFSMDIVGNDRPGIVRDITHALAARNVNVEEFSSECFHAPLTGEPLFNAMAVLKIPVSVDVDELRNHLEELAHEMMVSIALDLEPLQ